MHIAVFPLFFSCIFSIYQFKRIFSVGIQKVTRQRTYCILSQTLRPSDRRIYQTERASFYLSAELIISICIKQCISAEQLQHTGRSKSACRLHQFAGLSYRKRKHLDIVKIESAYVYLPCLTIAYDYTVIHYSSVFCTETSYRNSLQSTYAPVILYIGTCKPAHCICNILKSQSIQFFPSDYLCRIRHSIALRHTPGTHRYIGNVMHTPAYAVIRCCLCLCGQRSKNGQQYGKTQASITYWSTNFHQLSV